MKLIVFKENISSAFIRAVKFISYPFFLKKAKLEKSVSFSAMVNLTHAERKQLLLKTD